MAKRLPRSNTDGKTYREITKPWYGTARWKRRRKEQLEREPLCWMCERDGLGPKAASVADHDPPHKGDETIFWTGRLRSVCKRHHDSDSQRRDNGGKPKPVTGLDGWPIE